MPVRDPLATRAQLEEDLWQADSEKINGNVDA